MKNKVFLIMTICFICGALSAGTYTVEPGGVYPTIQSAIDAANHGDEIIVKPGIYLETAHIYSKNIYLHSDDPTSPSIIQNTKIDGNIIFAGDELTTCVISGLKIDGSVNGRRAKATLKNNIIINGLWAITQLDGIIENNNISYSTKGISDCDGIIRNNTITDSEFWGLQWCDGVIEGNLIAGNQDGGLISCHALIQNNIITENITVDENGGGLFNCDGVIKNNIITYNTAKIDYHEDKGLGGAFYGCDGEISNNLIQDNVAETGAGLYLCNAMVKNNRIIENDGNAIDSSNATIFNNLIIENRHYVTTLFNSKIINNTIYKDPYFVDGTGIIINNIIIRSDEIQIGIRNCTNVTYNCLPHSYTGVGNIIADPMFNDVSKYDFRLKAGSPCIDAGDPSPEYNDACSPPGLGGVRNDMGAYGGPGNSGWPLVVDDYWIKNFILKAYYPSDEFKLKLDINGDSVIDSSDIIEYVNQPKKEK